MIRRLIILLLIVGCDRYEFKNPQVRYDKWTGNVHILKMVCSKVKKINSSSRPFSVKLSIDGFREKRQNSIIDDCAVYNILKKSNPYLEWDECDKAYDDRKCKKKWVKQ